MAGLAGKRALVTGSTSGIGLGIARQLAAEGCSIMLHGFGDPPAVERLRETLERERRVTVRHDASDLTRPEAVAALVDATVDALGGIDILVNNAGIQHTAPVDEFPPERWDAILALNRSAVFHATRRALPHMKRHRWGRILNTASVHGLVASPNKAAYVAAKHAVVGLTKVVALETAGSGITCNAICPGWTRTELVEPQIASRAAALGVDLREARVAFLASRGFHYVAPQWGIWRAGGVAVPLAPSPPPPELEYVIRDADASVVVADAELAPRLDAVAAASAVRRLGTAGALAAGPRASLPDVPHDRAAMILYTSGTTGKPKGVVTTHGSLRAQVTSLVTAWEWTADDRILLVLPLHHVHGIVNVLGCALWSGARCDMLRQFDALETWKRIARGDLTLFMAVPTIYHKLMTVWEAASPERRREWSAGCGRLRLMVSGSAALPVRTLERWREITGHTLLERYGMTGFGLALSHPLAGERRPGVVGTPLPGVEVRLVDEHGSLIGPDTAGELEVRGSTVFREYWRRPDATAAAFRNGWVRTGDVAVVENGCYPILGRPGVGIFQPGGCKNIG